VEKISVIITVRNDVQYIGDCIKSIFNSTYRNLEVIIVSTVPSDTLKAPLRGFSSDVILLTTDRCSPASARNFGLKESTGRLVSFFKGADVNGKMRLELSVKRIENNPQTGMVFCGTTYINECGEFLTGVSRFPNFARNQFLGRLFERNWINTISTTLIKTDILKSIGGLDESFPLADDYDLYLRIGAVSAVDYIDLPLVRYRVFPDRDSREMQKCHEYEAKALLKYNPGEIAAGLSAVYEKEENFRIAFGKVLFKMNLKEQALKQFQRTLQINSENADGYFFAGNCHIDRREYERAVSAYKECLTLNPEHGGCHNNLGVAYFHQGDVERSLREFHLAAQCAGNGIETQYNLSCLVNDENDRTMRLSFTGTTPAGSAQPKTRTKLDLGSVISF